MYMASFFWRSRSSIHPLQRIRILVTTSLLKFLAARMYCSLVGLQQIAFGCGLLCEFLLFYNIDMCGVRICAFGIRYCEYNKQAKNFEWLVFPCTKVCNTYMLFSSCFHKQFILKCAVPIPRLRQCGGIIYTGAIMI